MAQRLIVEGNDAIALAVLCQKAGLRPPLGYEQPLKFKEEFVKIGEGAAGAIRQLQLSLTEPELTHIGLVVDANTIGFENRWQQIRRVLAAQYESETLAGADAQDGSKVISENLMPTVGIWIMPDNKGTGYLEHFIETMVPPENELLKHATGVLNELISKPFNKLTEAKYQKSLLHTWLAWQRDPGKPFGQAIQSGYLSVEAVSVPPFLDWFSRTFQLAP
jgi:hypothetical protein